MRGAHVDVAGAQVLELLDGGAQRAGRVDHVVVDDAGLVLDIADDAHDLGRVVARTALVGDGERAAQVVGELLARLGTTHVRRHHDGVLPVEVFVAEVLAKQRQCREVVHRDVEEALDLALVQVKRDDAVDAGRLEQVGDETRGDRLARGGLPVLARVGVVGQDRGDGAGARAGGRVGDDEDLHQQVVDILAHDGLDEEHVAAADGLVEAGVDFAVGELLEHEALDLDAQRLRDVSGELGVARAGVDSQALLHRNELVEIFVHVGAALSCRAIAVVLA